VADEVECETDIIKKYNMQLSIRQNKNPKGNEISPEGSRLDFYRAEIMS
jgi:hypothetical protein